MNAPEALDRLNSLLPLSRRQCGLEPALRELHIDVLRSFATTWQQDDPENITLPHLPTAIQRGAEFFQPSMSGV